MDIDTAVVKNFETASGTIFSTFTDLRNATSLTELSRIYILRESPNGNFELSFGNKTTLGISPVAGNKVTVDYLSVKGADPMVQGIRTTTTSTSKWCWVYCICHNSI